MEVPTIRGSQIGPPVSPSKGPRATLVALNMLDPKGLVEAPRSRIFPQMASHKSRLLRIGANHHLGPRASPSMRPLKSVQTVTGKTHTCKT